MAEAFLPAAVVIGGTFPWWLLLMPWKGGLRGAVAWLRANDAGRFLFVWVAATICFFTLSKSQLATYLLPAVPPVAVGAAAALSRYWQGKASSRRALVATASAGGAFTVAAVVYGAVTGGMAAATIVVLAAALALTSAAFWLLLARGGVRAAVAVLVAASAVAVSASTIAVLQRVSLDRSYAPVVREWHGVLDQADTVYLAGAMRYSLTFLPAAPG